MVDALSRRPHLCIFYEIVVDWKEKIQANYAKNTLVNNILDGTLVDENYNVKDGLIFYKERIFLVPETKMKEYILKTFHDTLMAGHIRFYKTYRKICERFSWKGMKDDITKYVCECQVCQKK